MKRSKSEIELAYGFCLRMAKSHYENFPVASILLPKKFKRPISAIYAFARSADDMADEGELSGNERLNLLNEYSKQLNAIAENRYQGNDPIFIALNDSIHRFGLSIQLFEDLLIAFRQDVVKSRYANFQEVLEYCRFSANPVGRMLLQLKGFPNAQQLKQSDAICTALQLINFYQDVEQDLVEQNRIYIPQDEMADASISEIELAKKNTTKLAPLLRSLYKRTHVILSEGIELGMSLDGRLGWEIRAMTLSGFSTLSLLTKQADTSLLTRPRLSKPDLVENLLISISKRRYFNAVNQCL